MAPPLAGAVFNPFWKQTTVANHSSPEAAPARTPEDDSASPSIDPAVPASPVQQVVSTLSDTLQADDPQAAISQTIAAVTGSPAAGETLHEESGAGGGSFWSGRAEIEKLDAEIAEEDREARLAEEEGAKPSLLDRMLDAPEEEDAQLIAQIDADREADKQTDEEEQKAAEEEIERERLEEEENNRHVQRKLAADVAKVAPIINVTPEMLTAFKAENPLFAQMDDATAAEALRDILAHAVVEHDRRQVGAILGDAQFDRGEGAAIREQSATGSEAAGEPAQLEVKPSYSLWSDIKSIPGAIAAGVAKSGFETYDAVNEIALGNEPSEHSEWRKGIEGYYDSTSGLSGAAAVVAQFGAAFVGFGKFAKLAKIPGLATAAATRTGQIAQASAKGAAADFLAFDGMQGRLSDLVQQYPTLENPVTEFLATNPDDSEAEGRLKNALEGISIGATVDVVLAGFRAMRAHKAGNKEAVEQAIEDADEAFDQLNGKPQAELPELRAANDDPAAAPQAFADTPPHRPDIEAPPQAANDMAAPSPGSLPRPELEAAASRMAQRVAEDPLAPFITPEIAQPIPSTFDSLFRGYDLRAVVDATEREILKGIEGSASAKGVVSIQQSQRLAKEFAEITGQDQGHFYVRMASDAASIESLHARLLAYDQVTRTLAVEVRDLAHAVKSGSPGQFGTVDALKEAFEDRLAAYAQVQDWLKGVRSETGRTLAIMRHSQALGQGIDTSGLAAFGQGRGAGISPVRGNATAEELAEAVIMAGTDRKMLGNIANPTKYAQVRDALVSLFIKNILSGPTTHLVNILGNVSATLAHPATKILGGAVSRDVLTMREGIKQYGFMVSEASHALGMAIEAYKRGHNILDPAKSKFHADGQFTEALTASKISGGAVPDDSVTGWLANGAFKAIDAVSTRALSASDEFFKQTLYASELTSRAWAEGVAQRLEGDALKGYIKQQRDAAFASVEGIGPKTANVAEGGANAQAATEVARFATFTKEMRPGTVGAGILHATNKHPELKFAVPFVRVVSNLLEYTGNMTPIFASRMTMYKDAMARGGRDAVIARGRLAMGYAVWTTALGLAASGQLTGAGPVKADGSPDYKRRQLLAQTGWKPNALRIGDTYIDLSRMDPFGLPFNIAAQAFEKFQLGMRDEKSWIDIAATMTFAVGHSLLDRQYLQGLADFMEALNDDSGYVASRYIGNIAASLAVPNFIRQTVTTQSDPVLREARGVVEQIMRRTPGLSDDLAARRMRWGARMELQPSLYGIAKDDPLMREYARLLEAGHSGGGEPLPRMKPVPGGKSIDMAATRLSNGELLYDVFGDLIEQPDPSVESLSAVLGKLIESDAYKNDLIDGPGALKGTRLKAWQTIMSRYRSAAWRKVLETYPEVRERFYGAKEATARAVAAREAMRTDGEE